MADYEVHVRMRPGQQSGPDPARVAAAMRSPAIVRDLTRRADNVATMQRRTAPRHTGRLAATIRTQLASHRGGPAVQVITGNASTPYLGYVEYGTRPHVITPKGNRRVAALRFASGGRVVFARRVRHPGNRESRFVRNSVVAARP